MSFSSLATLPETGTCDACNTSFRLDFDRAVEARFTVHAAVRSATSKIFCRGGPMNTPHIRAQVRIPAKGRSNVAVVLPPAAYVLRSPQAGENARVEWRPGSRSGAARVSVAPAGVVPALIAFDGAPVEFSISNETDGEILVILEEEAWEDTSAPAALVTTMPEFRELFPDQNLSQGRLLGVRSLAFVACGAADAPRLDVLTHKYDGAVVSVSQEVCVAAFLSVPPAMSAALDLVESSSGAMVAVHVGPVNAMNVGGRLSYTGATYDDLLLRRGTSAPGQPVVSVEAHSVPGVREILALRGVGAVPGPEAGWLVLAPP